ncbi:DUF1345 domain-containing protein [Pigmentiphaga litoralis]|uniref:Putative membrane protein n=1 Tax=Pigmentiphaga litoralis TaxID=516702 RepID=A0A7Y9IVP6_9BURK|nr:putative membrane protein [Pigmentiphaga litoralis]NYE83916.1 putative membrane protein [Pigmentiphaga litoralis]
MTVTAPSHARFLVVRAHPRLFVAALILVAVATALWMSHTAWPLCLLLGFDAAAFFFLSTTAYVFAKSTPDTMRHRAKEEDVGRWGILWTSVLLSAVVLLALGVELRLGKGGGGAWPVVIAIGSILLSWLYMNVMFALHYAHGFYGNYGAAHQGLEFPGAEPPDYWDFAYFALVIGMTFQVSDVQITSRHLRRMALVHSVIAFFLNVFIIAMSVNVVAGQA